MKVNFKMEKGITLVALVVTIVVLLILTGISIQAITNTGLFGKARQAEQKNLRAKKEKYLDPKYKMLYDDIEDRFQGFFGTKVKLDQGKRKGKIIIEYNGNSDLERILDLLK